MSMISKLACLLVATAMVGSIFTGCKKSKSNNEESKPNDTIVETTTENGKTEQISGTFNVYSFIDVQTLGANPNVVVKATKVPDSSYKQYIEYVKVKDKIASGYKLNDKVEIVIKFHNNVDISELSLTGCVTNKASNTCTYTITLDSVVGEYISGADFANANSALDSVCNDYANIIANKIAGGTWGSNKVIQRVKGYSLMNSYSATAKSVKADDSVNLGREASRLSKAVNGIIREYSFDIVYSDGTEANICTMLILPNVYKMTNGSYKLVASDSIYNVGTFKAGNENEIIQQFKNMTIDKIDTTYVGREPDPTETGGTENDQQSTEVES